MEVLGRILMYAVTRPTPVLLVKSNEQWFYIKATKKESDLSAYLLLILSFMVCSIQV